MTKLHISLYDEGRIRYWTNELDSPAQDHYETPTHYTRLKSTGVLYEEVVVLEESEHVFEPTDIIIPQSKPEEEQNDTN